MTVTNDSIVMQKLPVPNWKKRCDSPDSWLSESVWASILNDSSVVLYFSRIRKPAEITQHTFTLFSDFLPPKWTLIRLFASAASAKGTCHKMTEGRPNLSAWTVQKAFSCDFRFYNSKNNHAAFCTDEFRITWLTNTALNCPKSGLAKQLLSVSLIGFFYAATLERSASNVCWLVQNHVSQSYRSMIGTWPCHRLLDSSVQDLTSVARLHLIWTFDAGLPLACIKWLLIGA